MPSPGGRRRPAPRRRRSPAPRSPRHALPRHRRGWFPAATAAVPEIEPSTSSPPPAATVAAIPSSVSGETAFMSTTSGGAAVDEAIASATAAATAGASAGGATERTTSLASTTATRLGRSRNGASAASRRVRGLRPSTLATTSAPPRARAAARPLPIAPGLTTPTTVTSIPPGQSSVPITLLFGVRTAAAYRVPTVVEMCCTLRKVQGNSNKGHCERCHTCRAQTAHVGHGREFGVNP